MRSKHLLSLLAILGFLAILGAQMPHDTGIPAPPRTQVNAVKETMHGVVIVDPYRWLEDQNSPRTRKWIDAENAYTDSLLSKIAVRDELRKKLSPLLNTEYMSWALVRNGHYFFLHRRADQDQPSLYMRNGVEGRDELLVDPLALSPEHTTTVNISSVSRDGSLIVYSLRQGGEDEITPHLLDVVAHKELPDKFPRARYYGIALLPDKKELYYTKQTDRGPRVYGHKVGTAVDHDREIFGKGYGREKIISSTVSPDGRYLVITVSYGSAAAKTEVYFQDLQHKGPVKSVVNNIRAAFFPAVAGDMMYLRTDWKAPRSRLLEVDLKNPGREHWREIIPQGDAVLENVTAIGGKLVARFTKNVVTSLKVLEPNGKLVREIDPPTLGTLSAMAGTWDSTEGFYAFNSFYIPTVIYRYDVATGKQTTWFQAKIPVDADQYEVKQVWYPSKDGTKIPMFLVHAKGIKLDGSHPVLLTGYGGFDVSSSPSYSPAATAWISSGGVFALANLRGGGEFGEDWHHAGMLEKKQNVFDDFIAAAEWLIQNKYTTPQKLAIRGASNGGLLVGAALTQRPDLFGAVICGYPLLDMLRYEKFLVAGYWVPEYGSAENADQFKYIYAYSPYQHVKAGGRYPAVLLISGDSDTRVAPLHARKMTALLQASNASDKPILLHYDTSAGHSGGTPVSKQIENTADELSFLMWQLGMTGQTQTAAGQ
ncbi:MAG TPA: prolyl oligopeptidase family serine peptidase [Candidatus Limnocylindrales bacterium]|nr:prolyl oligopeptidase family serine peptidase [Candidatus Limnocylindrales bacterium]